MKKLKYIINVIKILFTFCIAKLIKLFNENSKNNWLISERDNEAQDNGFYLFKYIRENYPLEKVYYVIDKKADDYGKIKDYSRIIQYNSLKHYIYYFLCEKHISAFQFFGVPDDPLIWKLESWGFFKKKRIFLQHGITKEILPFLKYENTHYDLFICGGQLEYEFVKKNFGYPTDNVRYLGFCRFDNLHVASTKRQILIMPTWRQWIGMTSKKEITTEDKEMFLKTEYYQTYQSLILNEKLMYFIKEENIELLFYPHPEMQKYLDLFYVNSPYVRVIDRSKSDLQTMIKEALLLVTDYSSIAFDRAYIKKPLIYYHFDQEEYYKNHFEKGYFDAEKNGFGPVVKNEIDLVEEVIKICRNGQGDSKYTRRSKKFFILNDTKNCERTYEAIKSL